MFSPDPSRRRLLVVGAGASFAESRESGFKRGDFFFANPSTPRGSVDFEEASGKLWSLSAAIIAPRLQKKYAELSIAGYVLSRLRGHQPSVVTFWGVGLAESDVDLLDVYKQACDAAKLVEFVNPDAEAFERAGKCLGVPVTHYKDLGGKRHSRTSVVL